MPTSNVKRIVCTGVGLVCPLGTTTSVAWSALRNSSSGIIRLKEQDSFDGCRSRVAAYVPQEEFQQLLDGPKHSYMIKNSKQLSRATSMAMLAAHEALEDALLLDNSGQICEEFREESGVAIGQGMVDFSDIYENGNLILGPSRENNGYRKMSPYFMTRALINMSAGNLSIRYKLLGPNHCVSTACATGAHSIGDAMNFIRLGKAKVMVCGSTEASINSIAMAGFERLRALSMKFNQEPATASRPFDEERCGFVMGEGAGVVILEELEHAKARGIKEKDIYCELLGYGTSADAHHLTAPLPDGSGAIRSMKSAIRDSGLDKSKITHVNAHATSTPLGDDIECDALEKLFYTNDDGAFISPSERQSELSITSCKGAIGHLLGGSGSVESIFAMLSCRDGLLPPCLNLRKPLKTKRNLLNFVQGESKPWSSNQRILVKNSFGFGGTNASLVISNYVD